MFSWITGPRNSGQELPPASMDNTYIEPPETPAPVFAARAIKHVFFGTPQPPETVKPVKFETRANTTRGRSDKAGANEDGTDSDTQPGSKRGGILSTPGTAKGRKTVSFGAHVVDNEGKKSTFGTRSGLPNDFPCKFPSPWTPKTDMPSEAKAHSSSKLTAKLYEVRESTKAEDAKTDAPKPKPKPRAKDDADVTIDIMEPRSESGRYWREQYQSYSDKSENEVKKLVKKQQLAKEYAKKKDAEALELAEKLEAERRRHKQREKELEEKNKDYKERLRQALAENLKSSTEMAMLRQRLAALESQVGQDVSPDQSLPKTELELEFDEMMLDPQQASYATLDATPVTRRRNDAKRKPEPSPSAEPHLTLSDAIKGTGRLSLDDKNLHGIGLEASPRRPRRSTVSTKSDKYNASRTRAKTTSTSAPEDPWMATGESVVDPNPNNSASPPKGAGAANRSRTDRPLQPLANPKDAAKTIAGVADSENISPEAARKKLALERVAQKKREREKGKENAKTNVLLMR